jgi:DNA-directed RNA polymerase subunit RPC12/RpoP
VADRNEEKEDDSKPRRIYDACPHCGHELSPWQQVLLSIDRALVCKNCWYRIILDSTETEENIPRRPPPAPPTEEE